LKGQEDRILRLQQEFHQAINENYIYLNSVQISLISTFTGLNKKGRDLLLSAAMSDVETDALDTKLGVKANVEHKRLAAIVKLINLKR
jgi:hypothetical protein